jgi:hypothetical protein
MSKILHSFTLHDHTSELLRRKSKKGYMSQNVSAAIEWYTLHPAVWDDLFASIEEQESLILFHECPECGGSVEA